MPPSMIRPGATAVKRDGYAVTEGCMDQAVPGRTKAPGEPGALRNIVGDYS